MTETTGKSFRVLGPAIPGGDNSFWTSTQEELARYNAELVLANFSNEEEFLRSAEGVDGVYEGVDRRLRYTRSVLSRLPNLKVISSLGVGVDFVDVEAATDLGIVVVNLPQVFSRDVAIHTFSLILALSRKLLLLDSTVKNLADGNKVNFLQPRFIPVHHLYDETLGVISFGHTGREVARLAKAFGMNVIVYSRSLSDETAVELGVEKVDFDELFRRSDIVSVHTTLTKDTYHWIGEAQFQTMKRGSLFINTSRGAIVDEAALIRALEEDWIGGAGLDVFETEPPPPDNPLLRLGHKVVLTPHSAGFSARSNRERSIHLGRIMGSVLNGHRPSHGFVNPSVSAKIVWRDRPDTTAVQPFRSRL